MPSIKTQDLYRVVITEAAGIAASGDVDFTVSVAPTRTNGFLVLSPENAVSREVVYFHNVIGNRIYVRGVNRRNPKLHPANDSVQMNDVEDIFNYYSDMVSPLFYMEKTGTLNVRIWGGTVLINRTQVTVADTNLTLTDNTTNYIVYDYLTNIISVNTTGVGLVKVTVTVTSGVIGTPTYNVIKESYADPFVPDTSLVAPVIQNNQFAYADSTGSANAYEVSYTPAPTAYVAGQKFFFKANFQNTGAATINVNGLGAKSIKKLDGATDLASTDISSGAMVEIMYDGTNFQLTSIPQTIKNNDVTQLTSVNNLTEKNKPSPNDFILLSDSESSFVNKKALLSTINNNFRLFTAGENISIGDSLYMNTSGVVFRTSNDTSFIGFANNTASSGQQVQVIMVGVVGVLSGLTIGSSYFIKIPNNTWATKASITTSRESTCGSVVNNKIYVIGGTNGSSLSTNEEYDPSLNTWATKASMSVARYSATASAVNNKIYVIGGTNGSPSSANEEYDPSLNTWATKVSMTTARQEPCSSVVNNKIYVIGGRVPGVSSVNEEYDPSLNTWATKASMPSARYSATASAVNNKIYVIGGYNGTWLSTNEEYDPSLNTWATKASMTVARHSLVSGVVNNKIYAIGGANSSTASANEEYDPSLNTWATKTVMSIPKYGSACGVVNNKIYVIAGRDGILSPSVIEYDAGPFGVISTVSSSIKVGLALSATELLIKPNL